VTTLKQMTLDLPIERRVEPTSEIPTAAVEHGEVFTRAWIVDLILDLVGYTADKDLTRLRAVEPACGQGAFLGRMVERLSRSCKLYGQALVDARSALVAFDLVPQNVEASRALITAILRKDDWPEEDIATVVNEWIKGGDYLLQRSVRSGADVVVGNPPYIRLEDVPEDRMRAYRRACSAMIGRSDIYIGFFEKALKSLRPGGLLGFICADRWMRNQYGRVLRTLISNSFSVDMMICMHDVDAFEEQVAAYPAITILRRASQGEVVVVDTTNRFGPTDASDLLGWIRDPLAEPLHNDRYAVVRLPHWFKGPDSWPGGSPAQLAFIEELNGRFPPLEDLNTGTRIGIGVATGADTIFITRNADLVEHERLLPLSMVRDTATGALDWSGHYLVNPWDPHGRIVDLTKYPRLRQYYERHEAALRRRNVAGRLPTQWYRTIDKVDHSLTERPKLLFPDMKLRIHPVLDQGGLYPHHNLYYVVSDTWDLRVLGGLLLSRVAEAFISAYAVRMRGGTLRFQAQYLRRIRVPRQDDITLEDQASLAEAFVTRDVNKATEAAMHAYDVNRIPV
jgi:adenine-specific DNA-methyltransferase